ncbi:unnamed protein product [Sphenostylis stenocarpa]|uniref:Uncharacterized protein n=1 Tax=Sphenostylis stenocarpa TaxID=92480 RepID=A0AA86V8J2_9FABA|nr:unnamed protein product [Sphenostylis stenocarpa]
MASTTSKATISVPTLNPNHHFFHLLSPFTLAPRRSSTFRSQNTQNTKTAAFSVRVCACHQSHALEDFGVTEEDEEFVKVLRESQPYVYVHRARVFVLLISAEIVGSPYLDPILKVSHHINHLCHTLFIEKCPLNAYTNKQNSNKASQ